MDLAVPFSSRSFQSFTPVRRRDSTINTRLFHADQEQEWTTARCHRLLRALTSRIAILKKDILRFQAAGKESDKYGRPLVPQGAMAVDAEWTKTKKRIRNTYSSRGGRVNTCPEAAKRGIRVAAPRNEKTSILPGEVTIPTPVLARARGDSARSPPLSLSTCGEPPGNVSRGIKRLRTQNVANDGERQFQPSETLRDLRQKFSASRYTTYEGIYNGLEALLRATAKDGPDGKVKPKGARSLLSMALSAVPRYITVQEGLLEAHMEATGSRKALDQRDISTEIYDELESFGSSSHGWKHLKVIVRSHGVQVICDAVHSGLFDDGFCGVLIALCINTFATDEAQSILSALLSSRQYTCPRTLHDTPSPLLTMLSSFSDFTGRDSYQLRELSSIMSSGLLPFQWLATRDFGSVWNKVMQRISPGLIDDDAVAFLDIALSLLASAEADPSTAVSQAVAEAVKNTFLSLLTTLSSIVILSQEARRKNDFESAHHSTQYVHIINILEGCSIECGSADRQISILLSNLITQREIDETQNQKCVLVDFILARLQQTSAVSPAYVQAVSLICQVARCCGRASRTPGLVYLEQIHILLDAVVADKDDRSHLEGLIVESAFSFAQGVPDRQHIDYAASMDERYSARKLNSEISFHESANEDYEGNLSGYRWEEGISEWVSATPAAIAKRKVVAPKIDGGDSDCDTPYRPPPKLRKLESQAATVVHRDAPLSSSPNFDDSVRILSLDQSPSRSWGDISDITSDDEQSVHNERIISSQNDHNSDSDSAPSLQNSDFEDGDDISNMDGITASDSSDSPGLTTSPACIASPERRLINRVPRLNRRLLRNSQEWQVFEDSFVSTTSSASSNEGIESTVHREFIDRAPRLGRRALRSSQSWQVFEDSDDELSILSASSRSDQTLKDIKSTAKLNFRRGRQAEPEVPAKTKSMRSISLSDSEDELCI